MTDSEMTNCWQHRDFLDLDPDWSNIRSSAGHQQPQQKSHHHPKQQHWPLPELEPLRLEMRLHHKHQASKLHQVAVRMSLPFGGTARLPCPVRQLGNKTVRTTTFVIISIYDSYAYQLELYGVKEHHYVLFTFGLLWGSCLKIKPIY